MLSAIIFYTVDALAVIVSQIYPATAAVVILVLPSNFSAVLHLSIGVAWWCDGSGVGLVVERFASRPSYYQVTTLDKLFTHTSLCYQAA